MNSGSSWRIVTPTGCMGRNGSWTIRKHWEDEKIIRGRETDSMYPNKEIGKDC